MGRKLYRILFVVCLLLIMTGFYILSLKSTPLDSQKSTLGVTVQHKENRKQPNRHIANVTLVTSASAVLQIPNGTLSMIEQIESRHEAFDGLISVINVDKPLCRPIGTPINGVEDLLCMTAPKFLPSFKNPCWRPTDKQFKCLPYFQIIGMDKSGSTDLFDRIAMHPEVVHNTGILGKETLWWSWKRYGHWLKSDGKLKENFKKYTSYFNEAAKLIGSNTTSDIVTGDGTPMDMWDFSGWVSIPQNIPPDPPTFFTPHLIKHMNPNVKLLVILRDPVERLFSDYFFLGLGKMTPQAFHANLLTSIGLLYNCIRNMPLKLCLFKREFHMKVPVRIHLGFYSIFLREWFKVFPREQFYILRTEDYSNDMTSHMEDIFQFLQLRKLSEPQMTILIKSPKKHVTKRKQKKKMLPESRAILERLYRMFNKELASVLHDPKYTWSKDSLPAARS